MSTSLFATDEGESPIAPTLLKDKTITNRAELRVAEAHNILKADQKHLAVKVTHARAPFDITWMKRVHYDMCCDVWIFAGQSRQENLNMGVAWHQVDIQLLELQEDLKCWTEHSTYPVLEQAVRLHFACVQIHPFYDVNGRWARMLSNIWLKLHGSPIVNWPTEVINTTSVIRAEYIAAIRKADAHVFAPLIELHQRYVGAGD